jgi:hypothetical protein
MLLFVALLVVPGTLLLGVHLHRLNSAHLERPPVEAADVPRARAYREHGSSYVPRHTEASLSPPRAYAHTNRTHRSQPLS